MIRLYTADTLKLSENLPYSKARGDRDQEWKLKDEIH